MINELGSLVVVMRWRRGYGSIVLLGLRLGSLYGIVWFVLAAGCRLFFSRLNGWC
jgi:hypothetical protein